MKINKIFKIKNKLKPKTIKELEELKKSRGSITMFNENFVKNVALRYSLKEEYVKNNKNVKEKANIFIGLYISSLITCWETFFRDIVIFIIETDTMHTENIEKFLERKSIEKEEILKSELALGEFMAKQVNFQNVQDTLNTINFLIDENREFIVEFIESLNIMKDIVFTDENYIINNFGKVNFKKDIDNCICEAFKIRHKIIHDANYIMESDMKMILKMEDILIILPQIIASVISKKYNQFVLAIDLDTMFFLGRNFNELTEKEKIIITAKKNLNDEFSEVK